MKQWIKVKTHYVEAQGPPLSAKVTFVRIGPYVRVITSAAELAFRAEIFGKEFWHVFHAKIYRAKISGRTFWHGIMA